VLVPVSIPSSGKTSVLELVRKQLDPSFRLWSISSDEIRRTLMDELTTKMKNISRKQAF
jgi:Ni2+-binding GTPase involved in maturation of urease and hydrogenase